MHALPREVLARGVDVFRRHAQARALGHGLRIVEPLAHRDHHAAARDAEVDRLIEALAAVLDQHVAAGDTEIGAAVLHIGRSVGRSHHDQPQVAAVRGDDQLARGFGVRPRPDADAREQRCGLVEDPPLRQRNAYARHVPSGYRCLVC